MYISLTFRIQGVKLPNIVFFKLCLCMNNKTTKMYFKKVFPTKQRFFFLMLVLPRRTSFGPPSMVYISVQGTCYKFPSGPLRVAYMYYINSLSFLLGVLPDSRLCVINLPRAVAIGIATVFQPGRLTHHPERDLIHRSFMVQRSTE